jgi:hypothetical protein
MSDTTGLSNAPIDPLAGLGEVSQDTAREHIATLVKGDGISIEAANAALRAKGFGELNTNSRDYAEGQKDALLRDDGWRAKYSAGDPEAITKLYQADLRIAQASGRLTDRTPSASDPQYDQARNVVHQNIPGDSTTYAAEISGLVSSLGMASENAKSLTEDHFAAIKATADLSVEEKAAWAEKEVTALHYALGEDAEAKITEASKILSQESGRKLDLNAIAKTNGVRVAMNLFFQSQSLKRS